ncbi:hypothetical protein [Caenispirillum bisanense]|uniref:Motility protein n=1 Tax=Caenispirillum bisanense TaxID=414052 RepID=A0A286GJI9_9PROT|nr:hypothetical protein [Caenispirillum bisanense]SOD95701.1 hypothetical protein SAMN05421508_104429 [Caenispirillum bisanense]
MDGIMNAAAAFGQMQAGVVQQKLGALMVKAAVESATTQLQAVADAMESGRTLAAASSGRGTMVDISA